MGRKITVRLKMSLLRAEAKERQALPLSVFVVFKSQDRPPRISTDHSVNYIVAKIEPLSAHIKLTRHKTPLGCLSGPLIDLKSSLNLDVAAVVDFKSSGSRASLNSNITVFGRCISGSLRHTAGSSSNNRVSYMSSNAPEVLGSQPEKCEFPDSMKGFLIERLEPNMQALSMSSSRVNPPKSMQIESNTLIIGNTGISKAASKPRMRMETARTRELKMAPGRGNSIRSMDIESNGVGLDGLKTKATSQTTALTSKKRSTQLDLGLHEFRFSEEQVLIDITCVPGMKEGDLAELKTYQGKNSVRGKKIYFIAKAFDQELRKRYKNAEVSILSGQLQQLLGLPTRSKVWVKVKDKETLQADLVELNVKDCLVHRGDMWIFSSKITGTCVYSEQKLSFVDSVRATVKGIYREGRKVFSGYIGDQTKVVFRSESARLVFVIQITDEMWHFNETGEIYFYRVVNSVFPTIFKKWKNIGTHHTITIVFSASLELSDIPFRDIPEGERPKNTKDYYRIVVDQVNIVHWTEIMKTLRREFKNIAKDLKTHKTDDGISLLKGRFSPVIKSNILETICLATTFVTNPFRQPDLRRTTAHAIIVTPGSGIYDVDFDLLKATSEKMQSIELSIDVLCLARPPLHIVPLLRYRDYENNLHYCAPSWINISFWKHSSTSSDMWYPRCKMHDLQMMGLTETEMKEQIVIDNLGVSSTCDSIAELMKNYDHDVFTSSNEAQKKQARTSTAFLQNSAITNVKRSTEGLTKSSLVWNPPKSASPMVQSTGSLQVFGDLAQTSHGEFGLNKSKGNTVSPKVDSGLHSRAVSTLKHATKSGSIAQRLVSRFLQDGESKSKKGEMDNIDKVEESQSRSVEESDEHPAGETRMLQQIPILKKNLSSLRQQERRNSPFESNSMYSQSVAGSPQRVRNSPVPKYRKNEVKEDVTAAFLFNWLEIENPSVPVSSEKAGFLIAPQWKDVFPRYVAKKYSKWRSLTTPAELPITTSSFPSKHDFEKNFTFTNHSVILNTDQDVINQTAFDLLRDMIYVRLLAGFQICIGENVEKLEASKNTEGNKRRITKNLSKDNYLDVKFYMMLGKEIHKLSCTYDGTIDVQRHVRKASTRISSNVPSYYPDIKTRYENSYRETMTDPLKINREKVNWNQLDQMLAGYDDSIVEQNRKQFRSKFVILPSEVPQNTFSSTINGRSETLSAEEIRLEGFRRLISSIYRARLKSGKDEARDFSRKEEIAPEVLFYTGSLFTFIDEQAEILKNLGNRRNASLFVKDEDKLSRNISLTNLAHELQRGKNHLILVNRKWHWKKHYNCFIGLELVNWLIENFSDIDTRDDAVVFGQELMNQGLFVHVENRHGFLDGHYFYQISPEYVYKLELRDSSQNRRKSHVEQNQKRNSIGSSADSQKSSKAEMVTGNDRDDTNNDNEANSKHTVLLSNVITVNADSGKKSYKPEICKVHYDRVHNPDHCFHIRLEWLTATPKLIDDLVNNWARLCKRYGLKLVEVPWVELCTIPLSNPFHTFVDITLAINPWEDPEFKDEQLLSQGPYYYHTFLLERSGFFIDNRASQLLRRGMTDHEVIYSWGKPKFKYAQYIHSTGAYIAEIRESGNLFLAPNNRHLSRVNVDSISLKSKQSPRFALDAQKIMLAFKKTCLDYEKLRAVFLEAKELWQKGKDTDPAELLNDPAETSRRAQEHAKK